MIAPKKINGRFFDSDTHWVLKGQTYKERYEQAPTIKRVQRRIQEHYIDTALEWIKRLQEPQIILDAGCGFGRITKRLCRKFPYAKIYGLDISEDQIIEALTELPRVAFRIVSLTEYPPLGRLPINDLTTIIEVLMHISPGEKIRAAIKTITHTATDFILTVDWYAPHNPPESTFCFQHPYEGLFLAQGYELFSEKKIPLVAQKLRIWRPIQ